MGKQVSKDWDTNVRLGVGVPAESLVPFSADSVDMRARNGWSMRTSILRGMRFLFTCGFGFGISKLPIGLCSGRTTAPNAAGLGALRENESRSTDTKFCCLVSLTLSFEGLFPLSFIIPHSFERFVTVLN